MDGRIDLDGYGTTHRAVLLGQQIMLDEFFPGTYREKLFELLTVLHDEPQRAKVWHELKVKLGMDTRFVKRVEWLAAVYSLPLATQ